MHFVWITLAVLGVIFLSVLLLMAAMLFSPFVLTFDSGKGQLRVRWLWALEYRRPLPGMGGEAGMSIAGKSLRLPARKSAPKRRSRAGGRKAPKNRARAARFLRRCLGQPHIRRVLAKRAGQLAKRMLRSIALTRRRIDFSLPDPAWNGMLAGWLAARRGGRRSALRINFNGENGVFLEVRVYPYRIATALLVFSTGLPYRALWREWQAASAIVL